MKCMVITPVGPGHEKYLPICKASVEHAKQWPGPFTDIEHIIIDDTRGLLGRSKARNIGMGEAEFYFFLDADDEMMPAAFVLADVNYGAVFGEVKLNVGRVRNIYPCTFQQIINKGPVGTLSMGFFIQSEIARKLRFDESLDAGEDFDFYLRLIQTYTYVKLRKPLVTIGYDRDSATGPRGYEDLDWANVCRKIIEKYAHTIC